MTWYTTGTATVTENSPNVSGVSTLWSSAVVAGDYFALDASGGITKYYEIGSITSDTAIVLTEEYAEANGSNVSYFIVPASPLRGSITSFYSQLSQVLTTWRNLISLTGNNRVITLNETATTNNAGIAYQANSVSYFQEGMFANGGSAQNNWQLQWLNGSTWTPAISFNYNNGYAEFGIAVPTQAIDVVYGGAAVAIWDNSNVATGNGGKILLQAYNAGNAARITYAQLQGEVVSSTAGSETGGYALSVRLSGTLTSVLDYNITTSATFTFTGALAQSVAPAAGDASTKVPTTAWVGQNDPGGPRNKFRNATMDVWQRGTSGLTATTSGAYTVDGWIVLPTGASVTAAQAAGRLLTKNSLQVTGASSVTDVIVKQRIESLIAAALCSQTVTVQAQIYNDTGASITPTLTVKHAGSVDSWGSPTTDVSAVNLQACANDAWTQVAYTFTASASSYNGLEIGIDFGNNFSTTGKSILITELDIRVTPGVAAGAQNNEPPPPELRAIGIELPVCQRYYRQTSGAEFGEPAFYNFYGAASVTFGNSIVFPVPMRTTPTISVSGTFYTVNCSSPTLTPVDQFCYFFNVSPTATGSFTCLPDNSAIAKFSAEL